MDADPHTAATPLNHARQFKARAPGTLGLLGTTAALAADQERPRQPESLDAEMVSPADISMCKVAGRMERVAARSISCVVEPAQNTREWFVNSNNFLLLSTII